MWPLGGGVNDAEGFFKSYLAAPVVIVFWIGGYFWKHEGWKTFAQIDVDTGRREIDWEQVEELKERIRNSGPFVRGMDWLC